jgi:hypothetical protein
MLPLSMMSTIQILKIYHILFTYSIIYLLAFLKKSKHKVALSLPHQMDSTAMSFTRLYFLLYFKTYLYKM